MRQPKILRDLFTGPNGETWHLGRLAAVPMFVSGLTLPWVQLHRTGSIDLAATGAFYLTLAGAVWALVHGAKNMDLMPGEAGKETS